MLHPTARRAPLSNLFDGEAAADEAAQRAAGRDRAVGLSDGGVRAAVADLGVALGGLDNLPQSFGPVALHVQRSALGDPAQTRPPPPL
jgi:hypothetical protein